MNATESGVPVAARISPIVSALCIAMAAALAPAAASAQQSGEECGSLRNHYGPFDYRKDRGVTLNIVEKVHFDAGVESLTKPMTTTVREMAGDVGYTLRAFPNHHRALLTMQRLGERHKTDTPPSSVYSVNCYFLRAVQFAPDDTVVRGLYARYLAKNNRKDEAVRQLEAATAAAGDNALSYYNIGLIYYELGQYDRSLEAAQKAKALGLQRQELPDMLKRVNKWQDVAG